MSTTERTVNREEILAALHHANATAKKLPQIVGNSTWTTPWDRAHRYLNQLLYELQLDG